VREIEAVVRFWKLVWVGLGVLVLGPGCSGATDSPTPDKGGVVVDAMVPDTGTPDQGLTPNSGALCTGTGQGTCKHPKDRCLYGPGSSKGMCLMYCSQGTTCPHPAPGPYASKCAFQYTDSTGTISLACGWYCKYGGSDYNCPNDKDYRCWAPKSTEPNIQFCVPK